MRSIATASSLLLAGCMGAAKAPEPVVQYRDVKVPVAVGCVVDRPAPIVPLNRRIAEAQWKIRPVGAKAQSVRAQAGAWMNHADALNAATSGCADAKVTK